MSNIKRLIVLDLNGLLIHRVHKSLYVKCKPMFKEQYDIGNLPEAVPKGNFAVWLRPNVKQFLMWLMDRFHVAIWSSVLYHNIAPIVEILLPDEHDRSRLLFWWNQEHCFSEEDPAAKDPTNSKVFFKRLTSVWDDVEINERWLMGQPKDSELRNNTLLIDDNKAKVRDNPIHTSIHPRSWKLFELYDDNNNLRIYKDDVLENNGQLMIWLEGLLEWKGTVPEYVEKHPYVDTPLEEIKKKEKDSWDSSWK
ncbi:unnamed protein product [Rotaria magnacalcarata]|uniref:Mitochondrial import inner membrane translocase subunit TIM50 n=4 Tax=Rotaria magnacalcarata TaxID=392030 RepID=A0A819PZC5_9BILA|nr:unnamed protein product [Rotaria magnacalcarata]CAF1328143.1 unnamed protein product [Rotaria magnacalcarata]CAF2092546.1 unnamed protein product [Rotaria magnacalcarata]CAF2135473.1 unnamed protein product [Rotaria magnacalcarata]CAF2250577.1 unnamed protein product [Rotaria magnacalcarata]